VKYSPAANAVLFMTISGQGWKMAPKKPRFLGFLKKPKKPEKSKFRFF